jgi:hypothetical protein
LLTAQLPTIPTPTNAIAGTSIPTTAIWRVEGHVKENVDIAVCSVHHVFFETPQ